MTLGVFFGEFLFAYAFSFTLCYAISGTYSLFIRYGV
jgi:hypothetical protein